MLSKLNRCSSRLSRKLIQLNVQHSQIHTKFAIVGGGTAGMNVAGQLLSSKLAQPSDITVIEPNKVHHYQPGYTMVAGGVLGDQENDVRNKLEGLITKPMSSLFDPMGINFVNDSVTEYDPDNNKLYLQNNDYYTYDILVVGTGIQLRYDLVEGLTEALENPLSPVGSMYKLDYALKMNKLRADFEGGKVIANQPPMPFKCAGAPQKWIYLTGNSCMKNTENSSKTI